MLSAETSRRLDGARRQTARQVRRGDRIASILLAFAIGLLGALALMHWAACSQLVAMCTLAAIPVKQSRIARWRHWLRVQVKLHEYRHALRTAEIASEWVVTDQLVRAFAQADVLRLRRELQALERNS